MMETNVNKKMKLIWKEDLLSTLGMPYDNYSLDEIKDFCEKTSLKKGSLLMLSKDQLKKINLKIYHFQKLRFSYFANFILAKFTIENKKPSTKYFCSNENFNRLDEKKVNEIFLSIL